MRSTTTQEAKVLAAPARSNYLRVKAWNAAATAVDMTTLRGFNWVKSATWSESVDNYVGTAEVEFHQQIQELSLANLMGGSLLNAGGAQLEVARELTIETATMPHGVAPAAGDWHIVFHGYIDEVNWESSPVKVSCRDLAGLLLQDAQIEVERFYGTWEASRTLLLGYVQQPSGNPPNGQPTTQPQFWKVTTAGTTGGTEPAWPASPTPGATITDGTVTYTYQAAVAWSAGSSRAIGAFTANPTNTLQYWQCTAITTGVTGGANPFPATPTQGQSVTDGGVTWQYYASLGGTPLETVVQQLITDTLGAGVVPLVTPAASNWYLGAYKQSRDKLFQAITALVEAAGWDIRFAWNQAAGDFRLTLQAVSRTSPAVAYTFQPSQYFDFTKLARGVADVRNAVTVIFPDAEHVDGTTGAPTRGSVTVTDATSITKYRRRYMELAESATGSVTTLAMATALANAALSDLKEPLLQGEVEMPYFWPVQLNDYVTFKANGVHFDADQSVAVISARHSFTVAGADGSGQERTSLGLRGLPTMGAQKHLDKEATGAAAVLPLKASAAASNLVVTSTIAGVRVAFTPPPFKGSNYLIPELHVSASPGFTAGKATLKDMGFKSAHIANDLTPGNTYYLAIVMRDQRGNVASKSAEVSFVAGYAGLAHMSPSLRASFSAYQSTGLAQVITNINGYAQLLLDSEIFDPQSCWSTATSRWTVPATISNGTFLIQAQASFQGAGPGDAAALVLRKRILPSGYVDLLASSPIGGITIPFGASAPNDMLATSMSGVIQASFGDVIELHVHSNPKSATSSWTCNGGLTNVLYGTTALTVIQILA